MNAIDTNVLLYVHDPRDPAKQAIPTKLLATEPNLTLIWQVACEYIHASRKLAAYGFSMQDAFKDVASFQSTWQTILGRFSLSRWDAMLIAVCLESGVQRLYSEDFSAYPKIDSLEIVNPFLP